MRSSENPIPPFFPDAPSFPRRRESRPSIFRNIQRLPQYGLYPRMRFAEISVAAGLLIYSRGQSPGYVSRLQIPASRLKKYSPHTCQPCRHSRAGGNPDLRLSEIFNHYCSVGCVHGYGLRQYQLRRVSYIFSRAKPTLRMPLADTRKSSEKTVPTSLPATPSFPRRRESRPIRTETYPDKEVPSSLHSGFPPVRG